MRPFIKGLLATAALAACAGVHAQQTTNLKMQATWPASLTLYENFTYFVERVGKLSNGTLKIDGMPAEVFQRMGMTTVNMPGGEIIPAAQRGVIDCAEWVGGVEDLRLGFHNVWKYHYTPGMHENVTIGEVVFNMDVWKGLSPTHQEIIKSAANESFIVWWAKWQQQNADAIKELQEKHC